MTSTLGRFALNFYSCQSVRVRSRKNEISPMQSRALTLGTNTINNNFAFVSRKLYKKRKAYVKLSSLLFSCFEKRQNRVREQIVARALHWAQIGARA